MRGRGSRPPYRVHIVIAKLLVSVAGRVKSEEMRERYREGGKMERERERKRERVGGG